MEKLKQVNLIPKEVLRKPFLRRLFLIYKKNTYLRNFSVFFLIVAAASITLLSIKFSLKEDLEKTVYAAKEAKLKLARFQSQLLRIEKIKLELIREDSSQNQELELLFSTKAMSRKYFELLTVMAELVPQDLWINRCSLFEDKIQISGSTLDNQLITQFMDKLDDSGFFNNSRFTSSEKQERDSHIIYNFQIYTDPLWRVE
ncbi:MAG: PilN domain-containing protein [Candidatus Omnitrophota bacterium]|nr:PilN domain-containing protein [Candidatus Omnitrophota bacterium]